MKAYKCDICSRYDDKSANQLIINDRFQVEICEICKERIFLLLDQIKKEPKR